MKAERELKIGVESGLKGALALFEALFEHRRSLRHFKDPMMRRAPKLAVCADAVVGAAKNPFARCAPKASAVEDSVTATHVLDWVHNCSTPGFSKRPRGMDIAR